MLLVSHKGDSRPFLDMIVVYVGVCWVRFLADRRIAQYRFKPNKREALGWAFLQSNMLAGGKKTRPSPMVLYFEPCLCCHFGNLMLKVDQAVNFKMPLTLAQDAEIETARDVTQGPFPEESSRRSRSPIVSAGNSRSSRLPSSTSLHIKKTRGYNHFCFSTATIGRVSISLQ